MAKLLCCKFLQHFLERRKRMRALKRLSLKRRNANVWYFLFYIKYGLSRVFKDMFCLLSLSATTPPSCFGDICFDKTVTHLHFYAFVKFLAGSRYGLSGAKLKVPELVLHSEEDEREETQETEMCLSKAVENLHISAVL